MADNKQLILEIKAITEKAAKDIKRLEQNIDKTRKTQERMRVGTEGLRRSLGALRNNILLVTFAFSGMGAAMVKAVKEAVKFETLNRSFRNLGRSANLGEKSLQKLRDATNGTVKDTDLLVQANNALLLGIVQNEDQLAAMFDAAQRLAQAVGQDALYGIESLTTGIGRQSRLMLDNLGIIVDTNKAYEKFAAANEISVKEMTDFQRKQAFIDATMESVNNKLDLAGDEIIDLNQKMAMAGVASSNLSVAIGQHLAPGFGKLSEKASESINNMALFIGSLSPKQTGNIKEAAENILIMVGALTAYKAVTILASSATLIFARRMLGLVLIFEAVTSFRRNIDELKITYLEFQKWVLEQVEDRPLMKDAFKLGGIFGIEDGATKFDDVKGAIKEIEEEINATMQNMANKKDDLGFDKGLILELLMGQNDTEDVLNEASRVEEFINKIFQKNLDVLSSQQGQNREMTKMISLHEKAAGEMGDAVKNADDLGNAMGKIFANLLLEIIQLKIKLAIEKKVTKEKEAQAALSASTGLGITSAIVGFLGGMLQTGGSYINKFPTGGSLQVNKRTILPTNPPMIVGDNASGMERIDVTPLPSPTRRNNGNITININAPVVDEYVVDSIIPAIQRAQKLNL